MTKRTRSGFQNATADKIWNDHVGNNAFVRHRDRCAICLDAFRTRIPEQRAAWCNEGERIFDAMLDEIHANINDVLMNQN